MYSENLLQILKIHYEFFSVRNVLNQQFWISNFIHESDMKNMIAKLSTNQSKWAQYHLKGGPDTLRAADIQSLAERLVKEKE